MEQEDRKNKSNGYFIWFLAAIVLIGAGFYVFRSQSDLSDKNISGAASQCQIKKIKFYYQKNCSWCQKVEKDGTVEKIKELGVQVEEIDAQVGPIRDQIEGTPSFVIDGKVYSGYRAFDEIKNLLKCSIDSNNFPENSVLPDEKFNLSDRNNQNSQIPESDFKGDAGTSLNLIGGKAQFNAADLDDGQAKFFNVEMPSGKTVYFFAVKDQNGIYRAAANACQVCYGQRRGFYQEGDEIVCRNCGNRYPLEKIATEKGGCNPGPINPDLKIEEGKINITRAELEGISDLF